MNSVFKGLSDYVNNRPNGVLITIIEILLIGLLFGFAMVLILKGSRNRKAVVALSIGFVATVLSYMLGLYILFIMLILSLSWMFGAVVFLYGKEIRKILEAKLSGTKLTSNISQDEKERLIQILTDTCEYLSEHKVGALISIEREDSLNSYIDNAIPIGGNITQELLTTIFTVGTACHDGAVIIRGNKIMCAAAYFPSTDKYDIPKSFGTRHRAAIGLSERYDAFTLVVSEETGAMSYTIDGNIYHDVDKEKLIEELNSYIKIN